MTYTLGLFGYGPNPSAALLRNGEIIAFAEEERFNRIKMAPTSLPIASIMYCLRQANIKISDVDRIGFAWNAPAYISEMPGIYTSIRQAYGLPSDDYNAQYEQSLLWLYAPERIRTELQQSLALRGERLDPSKIEFLHHHLCHAASAFYVSGFSDSAVLTIDGSGEQYTTVAWHGGPGGLKEVWHKILPHTLGGYYATFTEFLGFKAYEEEGKLMGLAPFGHYSEDLQKKLEHVLPFDENGDYSVNPKMRYAGSRTYGRRFTDDLVALFGTPRLASQPIEGHHRDIAFNVQHRLEAVVGALASRTLRQLDMKNLCLAGGVAMNCKMNGKLAQNTAVKGIFVQPAAADNGVALGAALLLAREEGHSTFAPMTHAYFGPSFDDAAIQRAVTEAKLIAYRSTDVVSDTAKLLHQGRIIGWFQGRMEVGARALGSRSILANPVIQDMRAKINKEVKHREDWRPFCPSMPIEAYGRYFDERHKSDFMILAFPVRESMRDLLPAVVHVDGTARPQTVRREANPRFHALLEKFGQLSGHPVLLNTSFNIQGEPIVCTPEQALRCFGGTGIDALVMNDFIVAKPGIRLDGAAQ